MYDFILFDTFYGTHYKDLLMIAELLKDSGYNVAIAGLFQESIYKQDGRFPMVTVQSKCKASLTSSRSKSSLVRILSNLWNRFKIDRYLCKVIKELSPKANNFYAGTMYLGLPLLWLSRLPKDKRIFFWGLRSYFLTLYTTSITSVEGVTSWRLNRFFLKSKNISFFISEPIIKQEFEQLGFSSDRLVLRPERTIKEISINRIDRNDNKTQILIIGSLRYQKRIDLIMDVVEKMEDEQIELVIGGRAVPDNGFDVWLNKRANGIKGVKRIDVRYTDEEFARQINECDYLLLCDMKQPSCVSNGTMNDALLRGKPIIAPDYNPYKYYVEKYNVGILYDLGEPDSIEKALIKARDSKPSSFDDGILSYQKDMLYSKVQHRFSEDLSKKVCVL